MNKKKLDDLQKRMNRLEELRQERFNYSRIPLVEWKLKDVIPFARWKSILRKEGYKEALEYFPDKHDYSLFDKYAPKEDDEEYDKWCADYESLLIHTRNPDAGNRLCRSCILKETHDKRRPIEVLKRIILDATIQTSLKDEDNNNDIITTAIPPKYPCKVLNRFECPYKDCKPGFNDDSLVLGGLFLQTLCAAISFAQDLAKERMCHHFDVDVERESVSKHVRGESVKKIALSALLDEFKTTAIDISTTSDIRKVLGDPDLNEKLIFQCLKAIDPRLNENRTREEIVKWFMNLKDSIKLEELEDLDGELSDQQISKPCCYLCTSTSSAAPMYCNVRCLNCNLWICGNHLSSHIRESHPYAVAR